MEMTKKPRFRGFFSYAHLDAEVDPDLVEALTIRLEKRVTAKLLNARFEIWRDINALRAGARWDRSIEEAVRTSDTLIILMTPSWIASDYCRMEYIIFEEVEAARGDGEYIVPILVRTVEDYEHHLLPEQRPVYERVRERQYFEVLAVNFLTLNDRERNKAIDRIADDIVGVIERRRQGRDKTSAEEAPSGPRPVPLSARQQPNSPEVSGRAQNFNRVRFVSDEEVMIDRRRKGRERGVYVQADFIRRLYVEGEISRAIFAFHRAYATFRNRGPGELVKIDRLRIRTPDSTVYYVELLDDPDGITVCADPTPGEQALAELAFPPSEGENRLSLVLIASDEIDAEQIEAQLRVAIDVASLYIAAPNASALTQSKRTQVKALIERVARTRYPVDDAGEICLPIPVSERDHSD